MESERIERQKAANFSLKSGTAHAEIAQICLIYLLEPGFSSIKLDRGVFDRYPLARFAARYWHYHYENAKIHIPNLNSFILELFRGKCSFLNSVRLHDLNEDYTQTDLNRSSDQIDSPTYYAAFLELDRILDELIELERKES